MGKLQPSKPLVTTQRYVGTVKWARGSMAWLTCRALEKKYAGRDVFVHRNCCDGPMPSQWDEVSFSLTEVGGDPQGVFVKVTRPYWHLGVQFSPRVQVSPETFSESLK